MELTWQNVLVQAIPVLGGALAAMLGALPGYLKDKRELAAKVRMAADERMYAQENERQAKAYDERKNAYIVFLKALHVACDDSSTQWDSMHKAQESYSTLRLFCSDKVFVKANLTIQALRIFLVKYKANIRNVPPEEYAAYLDAQNDLVAEMRLDLGVHQTELC